jgi:hypothetical protein
MFLLINMDEFPDAQFWVNGITYWLFFVLPAWVMMWLIGWLQKGTR